MTQKELSYIEDAIGHEENIIKICNYTISNLIDEDLKSFLESELNTHTTIKNNLMNMLEGKANE